MDNVLNFVFMLVCIIILSIRLAIAGGRISKLEGEVDSMLISLKKTEDEDAEEET